MDFKYYKAEAPINHNIWFNLVDADGKIIQSYPNEACFASITHGFDDAADLIQIYQEKRLIPYSSADIKRWIDDINEMGFPCFYEEEEEPTVAGIKNYICSTVNAGIEDITLMLMRHGESLPKSHHNFWVNIRDYEDKNHFFSTLSLIRCLIQSGINKVPEEYFKLMDADPKLDKLEAVQNAHKIISKDDMSYDPRVYIQTGHMVTFDGNGQNVTKEQLLKRFAERKVNVRDTGYLRIHANWNGTNDNAWRGKR